MSTDRACASLIKMLFFFLKRKERHKNGLKAYLTVINHEHKTEITAKIQDEWSGFICKNLSNKYKL